MRNWISGLCVGLLATSVVYAAPPNTTASAAVSYEIGQGWVSHYFEQATPDRWFRFHTVGGRSYCIEAVQGSDSPIALNPNLVYYGDASGATALQTNLDGAAEPPMTTGSRLCFIDSGSLSTRTARSVKVSVPIVAGSGAAGFIRLRIYDTTIVGAVPVTDGSAMQTNGHIALFNLGTAAVSYRVTSMCTPSTTPVASPVIVSTSGTLVANDIVALIPGCAGSFGNPFAWGRLWIAVASPLDKLMAVQVRGDTGVNLRLN